MGIATSETLNGIADQIAEGTRTSCGTKVSAWAQSALGYDEEGEPIDYVEDSEAVSWCLMAHVRLWDSFPPSVLRMAACLADGMTERVKEMALTSLGDSDYHLDSFGTLDGLIGFGRYLLSDACDWGYLSAMDYESDGDADDAHRRAHGLVTFMERLNDSVAMTEADMIAWLRSSADAAARRGD